MVTVSFFCIFEESSSESSQTVLSRWISGEGKHRQKIRYFHSKGLQNGWQSKAAFPAFNRGSLQAWVKQSVKWRKRLADFTDLYHCFPLFAWWKLQSLFSPASTELNKLWNLSEWRQLKKHAGEDWELGVIASVISHHVYRNSYCASKAPTLNGCF